MHLLTMLNAQVKWCSTIHYVLDVPDTNTVIKHQEYLYMHIKVPLGIKFSDT